MDRMRSRQRVDQRMEGRDGGDSAHQWGAAVVIQQTRIGARVEQQLHTFHVACQRGERERGEREACRESRGFGNSAAPSKAAQGSSKIGFWSVAGWVSPS
jgi:hypothetical protein